MPKGLSPKQELFAQEVVKDGNQSRAYRVAYPSSLKWPDKTVWSKASTLMANGKVKARVTELRESMAEGSIADGKERRRFWTAIMRDPEADMKDRLKSSELAGRADGDFVERREISGSLDIKNLTDDELDVRIAALIEAIKD